LPSEKSDNISQKSDLLQISLAMSSVPLNTCKALQEKKKKKKKLNSDIKNGIREQAN
jgi:hypothetical protein